MKLPKTPDKWVEWAVVVLILLIIIGKRAWGEVLVEGAIA